jgi:hypothetical protein
MNSEAKLIDIETMPDGSLDFIIEVDGERKRLKRVYPISLAEIPDDPIPYLGEQFDVDFRYEHLS